MTLDRYCIPELLLPLTLAFRVRSKSPTSPPFQIKKVLPGVFLSAVVSPTMTPFSTLQKSGLPSHPERSLPLNNFSADRALIVIVKIRVVIIKIFFGHKFIYLRNYFITKNVERKGVFDRLLPLLKWHHQSNYEYYFVLLPMNRRDIILNISKFYLSQKKANRYFT